MPAQPPPASAACARALLLGAFALLTLLGAPAAAKDAGLPRLAEVYRRASPAIVGLRCRLPGQQGEYIGSGAIVDSSGLILTSVTAVPAGATGLRVFLPGGRVVGAELLTTVDDMEFSLLRIREPGSYPSVALGDSSEVRLGQTSLSLGNAFHSIDLDDRVSVAAGVISGAYSLDARRGDARYLGPVLETTAAFNDYMDGGPLLNRHGEVIGLLSLNYSTQRWLGTAIPINSLKPLFGVHRPWHSDRVHRRPLWLGVEIYETAVEADAPRRLRLDRVYADSPAAAAGLAAGFAIVAVDGEEPASLERFVKRLEAPARPALRLRIRESQAGEPGRETEREVTVSCWRSF